jgi:hypothetical protein
MENSPAKKNKKQKEEAWGRREGKGREWLVINFLPAERKREVKQSNTQQINYARWFAGWRRKRR